MDLSQEEKNRIYQEEFRKKQEEKFNNLSNEERQKVFDEESKVKEIFVNDAAFKSNNWMYRFTVFFLFLFFWLILHWGPFISIILSSIAGPALRYLVPVFRKVLVFFNCPYCNYKDNEDDENQKIRNSRRFGHQCPNCKREYYISYHK
jgi:hypothetical protein